MHVGSHRGESDAVGASRRLVSRQQYWVKEGRGGSLSLTDTCANVERRGAWGRSDRGLGGVGFIGVSVLGQRKRGIPLQCGEASQSASEPAGER